MRVAIATQAVSWFKREKDAEKLNLSPEFQRRLVWDASRQSYLIDTILQELPIPEIYMRTITSSEGDTINEIVDGQQRINAVLMFATNDLVLEGDDVSTKWSGRKLSDLAEDLKQRFWGYRFVVRELGQASDAEVRDLFRRVNINSVVLNEQELRHAEFKGSFIKAVEELADDKWWIDVGVVTVNQVRRMLDVEFVSELLVALMAGPQDKKSTLDEYYQNYETDFPDKEKWLLKFKRTRELISETFTRGQLYSWSGKSDFYSLFLLFSEIEHEGAPLPHESKEKLVSSLMMFREQVDRAKMKGNTAPVPAQAQAYADAVTRAASDLQRRADRLAILETLTSWLPRRTNR